MIWHLCVLRSDLEFFDDAEDARPYLARDGCVSSLTGLGVDMSISSRASNHTDLPLPVTGSAAGADR